MHDLAGRAQLDIVRFIKVNRLIRLGHLERIADEREPKSLLVGNRMDEVGQEEHVPGGPTLSQKIFK